MCAVWDSGSSLKMLTDRGLVKILGRKDEPGRPLVYGTDARLLGVLRPE